MLQGTSAAAAQQLDHTRRWTPKMLYLQSLGMIHPILRLAPKSCNSPVCVALICRFAVTECTHDVSAHAQELGGAALTQGFLAIWATFWRLPLIYIAIFVVRYLSIAALAPLLRLSGTHLTRGGQILSTLAALRGGISLILAQTLVLGFNKVQQDRVVVSQVKISMAGMLYAA